MIVDLSVTFILLEFEKKMSKCLYELLTRISPSRKITDLVEKLQIYNSNVFKWLEKVANGLRGRG